MKNKVTHRERLEACLSGELPDRPPVALWRHFPVDDQKPEDLAKAILHFQNTYDFDFVKVTPASSFCLKDWGVEDSWRGATEGTREYTKRVIQHPQQWKKLKRLHPYRGYLGEQLNCLKWLVQQLEPTTPVIQTIFSPLAQAKNLAGNRELILHLRKHPDELKHGLEIITQTTLDFIEASLECGISGIFYAVQHAQYGLLNVDEYQEFGVPYDLRILKAANKAWFNMLHIHGEDIFFDLLCTYPVHSVNWHDRETSPSLKEGQKKFSGTVCGGLSRNATMVFGTPENVRAEAFAAIAATQGKRFILGTGCVLPIIAPHGAILAARQAVDAFVEK